MTVNVGVALLYGAWLVYYQLMIVMTDNLIKLLCLVFVGNRKLHSKLVCFDIFKFELGLLWVHLAVGCKHVGHDVGYGSLSYSCPPYFLARRFPDDQK